MLSKKEKEYLVDIEAFEDKYARGYPKAIRSRIRKKGSMAIKDLMDIIKVDSYGREPTKQWRRRKTSNVRERGQIVSGGKRENRMIDRDLLIRLVFEIVKRDDFVRKNLMEMIAKESEH